MSASALRDLLHARRELQRRGGLRGAARRCGGQLRRAAARWTRGGALVLFCFVSLMRGRVDHITPFAVVYFSQARGP